MQCEASINSLLRIFVCFPDIPTLRITWTKLAGDPPILNRSTTTMPTCTRPPRSKHYHLQGKQTPTTSGEIALVPEPLATFACPFFFFFFLISLCIKRSVRKYPISSIVSRLIFSGRTHQFHPGRPQSSIIAQVRGCSTSRVSFFYPIWVVFSSVAHGTLIFSSTYPGAFRLLLPS
ncbi:hypothetical protein ASPFODRAFT_493590 [Aspergillus luchuensis CBS 106.47]|uniref:Uncharacterized protein n=1 Tax=Aspergillus luchuensis (strain CBS 106.47) TaxID=1137211 RepID=A0A1M3TSB4_ASPLC|nr:hypothetical protein ASPFODRAFT_493590 [Aspergillus luchuensis CBS 106.47]